MITKSTRPVAHSPTGSATIAKLRRGEKWLLAMLIAYGAWLVFIWLALHLAADRTWWGTVLLFTPRWFWAAPWPPLAVAAALAGRRWLVPVGILGLGLLLLLDVEIPWRKLLSHPSPRQTLKVLTCNCDFRRLTAERMGRVVAEFDPDIVAVQAVPAEEFAKLFPQDKWYTLCDVRTGLASRFPIRYHEMLNRRELVNEEVSLDDFRRYELEVDGQTLHLANLHLQSPRWGLRAVIEHFGEEGATGLLETYTRMRRDEAQAIHDWLAPYPDVIICGDFNTPLESPTYRLNFGQYTNAFSTAGWGVGNTFLPSWWARLRIDHILMGEGWYCRQCWVGPHVGPEHRPVLAELAR